MPRFLRSIVAATAVVLAAGCAGGSGCSCPGVSSLPNGFSPAARVENAASIRFTKSGLDFAAQHLGAIASKLPGTDVKNGLAMVPVAKASGTAGGVSYTICPSGPDPNASPPSCEIEVDLGKATLTIDATPGYDLHVHGSAPVRLASLPIDFSYMGMSATAAAEINGDGMFVASGPETFAAVDIDILIEVAHDATMSAPGSGYSKVNVKTLTVDATQLAAALHLPPSLDPNVSAQLSPLVSAAAATELPSVLAQQANDGLCRKADPKATPSCPPGSNDVGGVCRLGADANAPCLTALLGTDGHLDAGALLSGFAPGAKSGFDFVLAAGGADLRDDNSGFAWGDLDPIAGGATLGVYGGVAPSPLAKCVTPAKLPLPTGIPVPDELLADTATGWPAKVPGPHLGIALSERFANYALGGVYDAGTLCIAISTESVALLNSGTLGLLAASSKDLGLQHEPQQVAVAVRPNAPPTVVFGNGTDLDKDPLLLVGLKNASFDFYVFSDDRFIRFMTATFDVEVPLNLTVMPEGLTPVLKTLKVTNGKVTNSALLKEDPKMLADALGSLIAGQVGQFAGGSLKAISLNQLLGTLGLTLTIPDTVAGKGSPGLRKLTKGSDNYLGIFAALDVPAPPPSPSPGAHADVAGKKVDPAGLRVATLTAENAPVVKLQLGADHDDGTTPIEYTWRLDDGLWHPFTRDRSIDVEDGWLRVEGKHVIAVRARRAGDPASLDLSPALAQVVIDGTPPSITLGDPSNGVVPIDVYDAVSAEGAEARVKIGDGPWSAWAPAASLKSAIAGDADLIAVEARDGEGNLATAAEPLVRGRAAAVASGCGCFAAGAGDVPVPAILMAGVALLALRRRKR
jgi:MYXO-CTERM domain-containing protein